MMSRRRAYTKRYKSLPKYNEKTCYYLSLIFFKQIKILFNIRRGEGDSDSYLPIKIMVLYLLIFIGGESVPPGVTAPSKKKMKSK